MGGRCRRGESGAREVWVGSRPSAGGASPAPGSTQPGAPGSCSPAPRSHSPLSEASRFSEEPPSCEPRPRGLPTRPEGRPMWCSPAWLSPPPSRPFMPPRPPGMPARWRWGGVRGRACDEPPCKVAHGTSMLWPSTMHAEAGRGTRTHPPKPTHLPWGPWGPGRAPAPCPRTTQGGCPAARGACRSPAASSSGPAVGGTRVGRGQADRVSRWVGGFKQARAADAWPAAQPRCSRGHSGQAPARAHPLGSHEPLGVALLRVCKLDDEGVLSAGHGVLVVQRLNRGLAAGPGLVLQGAGTGAGARSGCVSETTEGGSWRWRACRTPASAAPACTQHRSTSSTTAITVPPGSGSTNTSRCATSQQRHGKPGARFVRTCTKAQPACTPLDLRMFTLSTSPKGAKMSSTSASLQVLGICLGWEPGGQMEIWVKQIVTGRFARAARRPPAVASGGHRFKAAAQAAAAAAWLVHAAAPGAIDPAAGLRETARTCPTKSLRGAMAVSLACPPAGVRRGLAKWQTRGRPLPSSRGQVPLTARMARSASAQRRNWTMQQPRDLLSGPRTRLTFSISPYPANTGVRSSSVLVAGTCPTNRRGTPAGTGRRWRQRAGAGGCAGAAGGGAAGGIRGGRYGSVRCGALPLPLGRAGPASQLRDTPAGAGLAQGQRRRARVGSAASTGARPPCRW